MYFRLIEHVILADDQHFVVIHDLIVLAIDVKWKVLLKKYHDKIALFRADNFIQF